MADRRCFTNRRGFLSQLSLAAAGSGLALEKTAAAAPPQVDASPLLPTISLGPHQVTRLIVGSNTISGYSYLGPHMDQHMREYFTPENIIAFLEQCEAAGINTHQFSKPAMMTDIIRTLRERGSQMKYICLHSAGNQKEPPKQVVRDTQAIAIVHHGGVTDRLFREGQQQQVHDFVKRVHDAGALAGVSAHNPDCIKQIADEGWENDLFMNCFYYLTRTKEELEQMPAVVTEQIGYSFFAGDPERMTELMRQIDKPCLGFKILAAGRNCTKAQYVADAFEFAFRKIKPSDGVIVGMYPQFHDEARENAERVRRLAAQQKA